MVDKKKQEKICCPKCKSNNTKKRGLRKTENRGKIQRYFCKDCSYSFVKDDGFFRMRNSPQKITLCMDLFYKGVSTRKVQEHLQMFYPHNSSNVSIYSWVVKYSKMIGKFTDKLKVNIGTEVQIDEVEYHRRKSHKARLGTDKNFFIDSICPKTKFMVASNYVKSRGMEELKAVIKSIKTKTEVQIKVITTDGLLAYPNAIKKVYGYSNKTHKVNVYHNQVNASKGAGFNFPIERLHNNLRARTQNFRGFHGSVESARAILKGFEISYNFIAKHQTIGKCPYELAVPELKEKLGLNKWLGLIKISKSKPF